MVTKVIDNANTNDHENNIYNRNHGDNLPHCAGAGMACFPLAW